MTPRRTPTDDQLRSAWHALARPGWGSFEAAQVSAVQWALVQLRARLIAGGIDPDVAPRFASDGTTRGTPPGTHPGMAPMPCTEHAATLSPTHWGSLRVSHPQPGLDRKRAAAGERADD